MDPSSIITQVARDEEQLNTFPPDKQAPAATTKKARGGLLHSLLCCFGGGVNRNNQQAVENENTVTPVPTNQRFLLGPLIPKDQNRKCMVIDLDETLVHSSFKPISNADFIVPVEIDGIIHQVYVLKRPYVDDFLQKMGEIYECVLFTASLAKYADPVADLLDNWNVFRSRLFRESCVFHRGNYVKDLSRLGRELSKVIIVDNSPASYIFHPDNAVPVTSWFDDMSDTELRDLIPFFETLGKADNIYNFLHNCNHPHLTNRQINGTDHQNNQTKVNPQLLSPGVSGGNVLVDNSTVPDTEPISVAS